MVMLEPKGETREQAMRPVNGLIFTVKEQKIRPTGIPWVERTGAKLGIQQSKAVLWKLTPGGGMDFLFTFFSIVI